MCEVHDTELVECRSPPNHYAVELHGVSWSRGANYNWTIEKTPFVKNLSHGTLQTTCVDTNAAAWASQKLDQWQSTSPCIHLSPNLVYMFKDAAETFEDFIYYILLGGTFIFICSDLLFQLYEDIYADYDDEEDLL